MGDGESLLTGLNNLDKFAYIGAFSSGGMTEEFDKEFPGLDAKSNSKIKLLWIACGTEDGLIGVNRKFRSWLKDKGVKNIRKSKHQAHTRGSSGGAISPISLHCCSLPREPKVLRMRTRMLALDEVNLYDSIPVLNALN